MTRLGRNLIVVVATLSLTNDPAEAAARKCTVPGSPIPVLVIDWVVIGDYVAANASGPGLTVKVRGTGGHVAATAAAEAADGEAANRAFAALTVDDIEAITISCFDVVENGAVVRRSAISVFTKSGTRSMLIDYLHDLMARQEQHREANGNYAESVGALGLTSSEAPSQQKQSIYINSKPPIEAYLAVTDQGWHASAWLNGVSTKCEVSGGSGAAGAGEAERGAVSCDVAPARDL